MEILGNVFSLCILVTIGVVYFQSKYYITRASKHFALALILSASYCLVSIAIHESTWFPSFNPILMHVLGFLEALLIATSTTVTALYVVLKLTEHTQGCNCFERAQKVFLSFFTVYFTLLVSNIPVGWIFSVDANGRYIPGPLANLEYYLISLQILMVVYCAIINRKTVSKSARLASWQSLFTAILCIALRYMFPDTGFLAAALAMLLAVFFLNFQSHRIGVNTLTMLNDKRRFFVELEERIKLKNKFNVFLCRIENYEVINSLYGHSVGDEVLYLFAFGLEKLFPEGVAFHIHSTTFAIVVPDNNKEERYEKKFLHYASTPIDYQGIAIKLKYCMVSRTCDGEVDPVTFYEQMTFALHQIQGSDKKYIEYTPELSSAMFREKHIISKIEKVDRDHGFEVWFQPIYSTKKKCFSSMEALIRLRESDGGFISPGEFIPIAEKTGLITPITKFVLHESCRVLRDNPWLDNIRASINLSISNLVDERFVDNINQIVDSYGIPHYRISFEFTERVLIEHLDEAKKNMQRLTESGYTFYLDDFGVGYSNFNCVLQLPLRTVKLDMSLTSSSAMENDDYGLVGILTDLFHNMGLKVVAEGAETDEQVETLIKYGVDGIQGYYFAKPMSINRLRDFLSKQKSES